MICIKKKIKIKRNKREIWRKCIIINVSLIISTQNNDLNILSSFACVFKKYCLSERKKKPLEIHFFFLYHSTLISMHFYTKDKTTQYKVVSRHYNELLPALHIIGCGVAYFPYSCNFLV